MTLVIIGASTRGRLEDAVAAFEAAGFTRIQELHEKRDGDVVLGVGDGGAELLRDADRRGIKYVLVHDGEDDRHAGGTYERAHHRIESAQREELASHLRGREAALLIDARFLDNPYWVPELRDLSGLDSAVADFVMKQPAAGRLLDDIEGMVGELIPLYREKGRMHVVVAFGCTGGQHRSVVLAAELARRLGETDGIDVDFVTRDIE